MRSGLGLPERRLKMLMKIRSARLYFLGNLIYFSCTTVSLTPVFQALGHRQLHVSTPGLAWPRSDLLSPGRAVPRRTRALRDGSGAKLLGAAVQVPWGGSAWGHGLGTPGMGTSPPLPLPQRHLMPPNHTMSGPAHPTGGQGQKLLFLSKQPRGGSGAKAKAARSPGDLSLRKYFLQRGPAAAAGTMGDSQREQS